MKRHLILLLLSYCSIEGYSRNLYQPIHAAKHFPGEITTSEILAKQTSLNTASKTTSFPLRLLGWGYSMNGTEVDSAWNYYSGSRGSTHPNRTTYTNEYVPGEKQYIQSDSSIYWELAGASLKVSSFRSCVYDNNNKVIAFYYRAPAYAYKQNVSYSNNLISGITTYDSTLGSFNPARQSIKTYNAQGYLITDSFYNLPSNSPFYKIKYSYDANNNLVLQESYEYQSGNWHLTYRITNTYASNLLQTSVREIDAPGGLINNTRDSFGYSGTNVINESAFDWDVQSASWTNAYRTTYHFNAQNFVDTFYVQQAGNNKWDTTEKDALVYDSNNLLTNSAGYLFQNDSFATAPYDNQNYYYETYFPASVNNTTSANSELTIFPNPTGGILHINTGKDEEGYFYITDINGRAIYNEKCSSIKSMSINTAQYSPGNYFIFIKGKDQQQFSYGQFTKI
jgi:hypothetical protein